MIEIAIFSFADSIIGKGLFNILIKLFSAKFLFFIGGKIGLIIENQKKRDSGF